MPAKWKNPETSIQETKEKRKDNVISLVSKKCMKLNDCLFFLRTKLSSLYVWSEIVNPSKPTALPTSSKPYISKKKKKMKILKMMIRREREII